MDTKNDYSFEESGMISRFTLAILGCHAIGLGIGSQMPTTSEYFGVFAVCGGFIALFFYFHQGRRVLRSQLKQSESCRMIAEQRLAQHVAGSDVQTQRSA